MYFLRIIVLAKCTRSGIWKFLSSWIWFMLRFLLLLSLFRFIWLLFHSLWLSLDLWLLLCPALLLLQLWVPHFWCTLEKTHFWKVVVSFASACRQRGIYSMTSSTFLYPCYCICWWNICFWTVLGTTRSDILTAPVNVLIWLASIVVTTCWSLSPFINALNAILLFVLIIVFLLASPSATWIWFSSIIKFSISAANPITFQLFSIQLCFICSF